jgi:hypothetical protein
VQVGNHTRVLVAVAVLVAQVVMVVKDMAAVVALD